MDIADLFQASWRKRATICGCGLLLAVLALLGSDRASAQVFTLTLQPNTLPVATGGQAYSQQITAVGGNGNYTYSLRAGDTLPGGITFTPGGLLSGTAAAGSYSFTLEAVDTGGASGFRPYTLNVGAAGGITLSPGSPLPDGTINVPYSQAIGTTGGTESGRVFSISAGSLPAGLSLNPATGLISGTPTSGGTSNFTVSVIDSGGNTGSQAYALSIIVVLTVNPATLPNGTTGTPYNQTVTAAGGTPGYTFAISAGALPNGLSLAPNGAITGTPTVAGPYNFTVRATDAAANTGTRAYAVNIGLAPLTINPPSLPSGTQSTPYNQTIVASGGVAPYSYAMTAGTLPPGLSLNPGTGVLSGTPTTGGNYSFTVQATDAQPNTGVRSYTVNIGTNSLVINPATLPPAVRGRSYSVVVTATGGVAPYSYSVSSGALPPGLALNATTGVISGTPTTASASSFTIRAIDTNGNTGSRAYTLTNRPDPALDPEVTGLVNAQVAAARRFALAQVDNVSRHLESLHDHFSPCSVDFGVSIPRPVEQNQLYNMSPGNAARAYEPNSPAGQVARRSMAPQECAEGWAAEISAWVSGAVQFGQAMPDGLAGSNKFTTAGLTAGIDWRAADNLIVGVAVGYGNDSTKIGSNGTQSSGDSLSATLYASYKPFDAWFLDGSLGFGLLGYDNVRYVANGNNIVNGTRKGSTMFGAVSTGYEVNRGALRFSPYVRADFMTAQLNAYNEHGGSAELLSYNQTAFNSLAATVGLRGSYDMPMIWGTLTPAARVEYRRSLDSAFQQSMYYADIGSAFTSTLTQAAESRGSVNTSVALRARGINGIGSELEYGMSNGYGKTRAQTIRAALKMAF